ncbi:MAG: acyloxyacyl hydrolase [Bacteroidetes bacterium]|nr:acyloxyacyl hydrolase [Bacteroidota bacterium]
MRYIVFAILILIGKSIYAQGDSYKLNIGLQPGYGFAWAHDKQVSAIENTSASSLTFEINKLHLGPLAELWHKNGYYNGFQFAYFHFSNSIIGQALSASYFIEPILLKNKQFTLSARGCLGLMYASHPFDSVGNPLNRNYSLYINPYLALSLIANYHFYDRYSLKAAVNYNHISNGNIQDPNYGLNFPTINLGIEKNISQKSHKTKAIDTTKCWRFDIVGFASNKSSTLSLNDRFWVYGFDINASRKIMGLPPLGLTIQT